MNAQEARDKAKRAKQELDTKRIEVWIHKIFEAVEAAVPKGKFKATIAFEKVEGEEPDEEVIKSLMRLFGEKGFSLDCYGSQNQYFAIKWE